MKIQIVVPFVGTWIEIFEKGKGHPFRNASYPSWVRGLKFFQAALRLGPFESYPSWVRGLKSKTESGCWKRRSRTLRGYVD